MRLKIVGPPGTGKTTTVLQYVKEYAERSDMTKICACTFTVSAKDEMKERVKALLPQDLLWKVKCSTIHSLAFDHIGAKKHFMVNSLYEFAKDQGERSLIINDRIPMNAKTPLEQAIAHYHIARTQMNTGDLRLPVNMTEDLYQHYIKQFELFKDERKMYDYTDVLLRYLDEGEPFDYQIAIIDEAQDLSMLQVAVTDKMFTSFVHGGSCEDLIAAGDDDQTIYAFAGVRAKDFQDWKCDKMVVLERSYRFGPTILHYSQHVLDRMETRISKSYLPSDRKSTVTISNEFNPESDLFPYVSCAILHRNGYMVKKSRTMLDTLGVTYSGKGSPFSFAKAMKSIRCWEEWRVGVQMYASNLHTMAEFIPDSMNIDRMEDRGRKTMAPPCPFPLLPWFKVLDLPFAETYMNVQRKYGLQYLLAPPKIEVTTIHQAKGGEWDKVIIITDVSTATWKELQFGKDKDAEHRVWYVAITRAKYDLQIIRPKTPKFYPLMEDL